ncbi:4Fe-4S dicluster domain-containing protein [Bacillus aquiflavi]|uniref:4Fe-4S dicluster domain-containing protein n=1 Tax=Bacillus aquiflavi TaxID=2672567 RepID=A0A6B3VX84_9BACI|nr:4Fe-4S dicluster domain-containing protein [Bacillus aquiflavi]MBA4535968.1 4Fe-4S dicluster domain-containing protein [Bacillus aquiflavi]NEY80343.1 4Fe-4S dicluster domain-containing protein [Bacillus aquiflavi]UAC49794.1 4Fe-4S dicluster domain-containing protein [Bacillus aquiflavi]
MSNITRRDFIKRTGGAITVGAIVLSGADKIVASTDTSAEKGTVIDLSKCDGCKQKDTPLCVLACREKNKEKFPKVDHQYLKPYWPQKKYEDYSNQQDETGRLTPYNWTFIDRVEVEHKGKIEEVFVPRRCMHCDHPTCKGLCPFGAIEKDKNGAVKIDDGMCMGGAKCRDVCPWDIPQRQAGVGLYTKIAPEYLGGGVMYKCDFCADLLAEGKPPACVTACPNKAITFGSKADMRKYAYKRAKEIDGYVYGDKENGGTATFYVSKVPFEKIDKAIKVSKERLNDIKPGRPTMDVAVENKLDSLNGMALSAVLAPVASIAAAGFVAYRKLTGGKRDEK